MTDDVRPIFDPARVVRLGDRLAVGVVIHSDGDERFWVFNLDATDADGGGCACSDCAPHEQVDRDTADR
ncbi:hypothetical protein [Nocardioides sp. HB32]